MINTEVLKKRINLNQDTQAREINSILDEVFYSADRVFYNADIDSNKTSGYVVKIPYARMGFDFIQPNTKSYSLNEYNEIILTSTINNYIDEFGKLDGVTVNDVVRECGVYNIFFDLT